jgi:mannose-6-phosphate isomerase-like protein (cupin superfamily)
MTKKLNLEKAARDVVLAYVPRQIAKIDDYHVFMVLFEGTFPWHDHDHDEFFLLLDGELRVEFKGGIKATTLGPMDALLVESGTEHQTVAPRRARALVFERQDVTHETLKDR